MLFKTDFLKRLLLGLNDNSEELLRLLSSYFFLYTTTSSGVS